MISRKKINDFRNLVNEHNFVLSQYRHRDGKNHWNIICSSMDWICVAASYLEAYPTPLYDENDDIYSVNVYTYISCIDMIYEAIGQLHTVIFGLPSKSFPYKGEKTCFSNILFTADDNAYFKLIRSCFGAHPVNLEDKFTSEKDERRYASWSGDFLEAGDFGMILYSNIPEKNDIFFSISFTELDAFLNRTYNYLDILSTEIKRQQSEHYKTCKEEPMPAFTDEYSTICMLLSENKTRFQDNDYYKYELQKLEIIFGTPISDPSNTPIVNKLKSYCKPLIEELQNTFQRVEFRDLSSTISIPNSLLNYSEDCGFRELCNIVFSNEDIPLAFLDCLKSRISNTVNIKSIKSYRELYVLVIAALIFESHD